MNPVEPPPVRPAEVIPTARRRAGRALAAPGAALAAIGLLPDPLGLERYGPIVRLRAFRPHLVGLGATVLALVVAVGGRRRTGGPVLAGLLAAQLVATAQLLPRVIPNRNRGTGAPFSVLAFNVFLGRADPTALADLIRAERPDVVALSEAGPDYTARLEPLLTPLGYRLHTSAESGPDGANVSAAVAGELGDVRVRVGTGTSSVPHLELSAGRLGRLRVVVFHAAAPLRGLTDAWRADLALLRHWCAGPGPVVVAGDLNATLDHSALRAATAGCRNAAADRGWGLVPTWGPSPRTRLIGPQIDHVFAGGGIATEAFAVHDLPGSDHRAVLARLRLPA